MIYLGTGSRNVPSDVGLTMMKLGSCLGLAGHVLRSGAAVGSDTHFEEGCDAVGGAKQIVLPYHGFRSRSIFEAGVTSNFGNSATEMIAAKYHTGYAELPEHRKVTLLGYIQSMIGVPERAIESPADIVILWAGTHGNEMGPMQVLVIAEHLGIPVLNLGDYYVKNAPLSVLTKKITDLVKGSGN